MTAIAMTKRASRPARPRWRAGDVLPKLVLAPSLATSLFFVYGFIAWTTYVSLTGSKMMMRTDWVGFLQYGRLWANPIWRQSLVNLGVFAGLFVTLALVVGLVLAAVLDQRIRIEGALRTIYLYPLAISSIVAGTAWKWILNPGMGVEHLVQQWGWAGFAFDWLVRPDRAIYTLVLVAVWQSVGFAMAMFLAGLRGVDGDLLRAAAIDGAGTRQTYVRIILPLMRPTFLSTFVILSYFAVKNYDLVVALTAGGPGTATMVPSVFMYNYTFTRNEMGLGAASAVMLLLTVSAIIVPYLYSELRTAPE